MSRTAKQRSLRKQEALNRQIKRGQTFDKYAPDVYRKVGRTLWENYTENPNKSLK